VADKSHRSLTQWYLHLEYIQRQFTSQNQTDKRNINLHVLDTGRFNARSMTNQNPASQPPSDYATGDV